MQAKPKGAGSSTLKTPKPGDFHMSDWVQIGEIGKPHGIKGGFWLIPHSDFLEWIAEQTSLTLLSNGPPRKLDIQKINLTPQGRLTVEFKDIRDRSTIENLRGQGLYVPESEARHALEDDEFLNCDLVGLEVVENDEVIGKVMEMVENPAHPILHIKTMAGSTFMLPFTQTHVPEILIEQGKLIANIPEGLRDLT